MTPSILDAALHYRSNGISVIPIDPRTKRPYSRLLPKNEAGKSTWKPFQDEIADEATIRQWFTATDAGVAAVCGAVSGGLLIIDTDVPRFYDAWRTNVGELADGLPSQRTGGGGNQTLMRCSDPGRNQPLAWAPNEAEDTGREIAMETRAEGGYAVLAPSLHPSGNRYVSLVDDLAAIPTISQARADALLAAARKLDEAPKTREQIEGAAKVHTAPRADLNGQASVIDAYNQAVTITDLLEDHKYTKHGDGYARPDGSHKSVTIDDNKSFHHNTNDPLANGYWHDAFDVYCQMKHAGDIKKAVKAAAEDLGMKLEPHSTKATKKTSGQDETVGRRYLTEDEIDLLNPPTWLIKNVVPVGEVTMVIGAGDAGKTFIVVDMVKRVAQHYPVMYIAAEDASGIRVRKRAWELYHRAGKNGNFMMWNGVLPLFEETEVGGFIDEVKVLDLKLIVIDTLSQSIAGADENSSKDMTVVMQHCQWIARETGAAVVVIHHTTKGGETYRGSSTLKNNTYGFLEVSKDDDLIKLECGRIKNTRPFAPRFFSLIQVDTDVADEEGQPVQSCVILPADRILRGNQLNSSEIKMLKALLDMTDADDGAKTSDLQKTLDLTSASFYRTLKRLRNLGLADKGEKQNAPLTITNIGRQRLAEESNDPQYQEPGTAAQVTPAFEVNTKLLSLLSDSSLPDSSPDSSPEGGSEQQTTITQDSAIDSEIITTIKLLSDPLDSSGQTTIYHSPPLKGRDDESSPESKPVSGLDHDQRRISEVRQALATGDIKAARKAAGKIQGRKDQQAIEAEIDAAAAGVIT
jgi:DNA-binding MarR family transcriptional regulator